MTQQKQKNPASGFRIMGIFNLVGVAAFVVFYFLYRNAGGENSYYFLIAAGLLGFASIVLFVMYNVFTKKLEGVRKP